MALVLTALVPALAVFLAGCGAEDATNEIRGKQLFVERCGSCHQLDRAGTAGTQGAGGRSRAGWPGSSPPDPC